MDKEKPKYKTFNTGGLCFPEKHYMVNPLRRLQEVESLIREELYFTIHAPRQTGKTTYLYALAGRLNAEGDHITVVASCERAGVESIPLAKANLLIIDSIYRASQRQVPEKYRPENPEEKKYLDVSQYLGRWAENQEKPIVLLMDEIDSLFDDVLVSILRQLRDGYQGRPDHFPASVVLVGLRDVRDYKNKVRAETQSYGTGSPFNIKSDSLFLTNFTQKEVYELLDQHGAATGQVFPPEVKEEIHRLSNGQPWLTNALARQMVSKILKYDFSKPVTMELLEQAKNQLILRHDTHLENLVRRLQEERVKSIVQAVINGENLHYDILVDDIAYVRDLGIVSQSSPLEFANPIYAEIIPRVMASPMQESFPKEIQTPWFVKEDGTLDIEKALKRFQEYYRRNSGAWLERYEYKESAHHLLLMAFLQRIVNAGGEIIREMAVGNGRIDMLVKFGTQEFALELKVKRDRYTIEDGKEQLARYLDGLGLKKGYLVIFDPGDMDWEEKIYWKEEVYKGKTIIMVGL
jgi:hypothetical protein